MENASILNDLFRASLDQPEERAKLAEAGGAFVRQKLRELSFARRIVPPVMVTKDDCQRSEDHDGLVKIIDKEPDSKALPISFRGVPEAKYIDGERYTVYFFTISSEKFQKTEQELLSYEMPITKIIEENSVKDIQKVEDSRFMDYLALAIAASGQTQTISDTTVEKTGIAALSRVLTTAQLKLDVVLMTQHDFSDILAWDANSFGDKVASEVVIDGYKYDTLLGYKLVTTIKGDIVDEGKFYGFAAPQFLGNFFILNQTKFWVDKIANLISFQSWEDIAMGIGNVKAAAEIVLTAP